MASLIDFNDTTEKYPVNDDVILFEDYDSDYKQSDDYNEYNYLDMYSYNKDTEYNITKSPFTLNNYDGKIELLLNVMWHCGLLSQDNKEITSVFGEMTYYIHQNKPTFVEFLKHPNIPELINTLELVDIKNDDPMFMAYYLALRYLK